MGTSNTTKDNTNNAQLVTETSAADILEELQSRDTEYTTVDLMTLGLLNDILKEMKILNMQMTLITDHEIGREEID